MDKYKHDPKRCEEELRKRLKELGEQIKQKPALLRKGIECD